MWENYSLTEKLLVSQVRLRSMELVYNFPIASAVPGWHVSTRNLLFPSNVAVLSYQIFIQDFKPHHINLYKSGHILIAFIYTWSLQSWHKESKTNSMLHKWFFGPYESLNMFRALLCPSSGACDYTDGLSICFIPLTGRSKNLQPCTRPATCHNQGEEPYAETICVVPSSWRWA